MVAALISSPASNSESPAPGASAPESATPPARSGTTRLRAAIRIVGAAVLTALIVRQVDFHEFAPILREADLLAIACSLLLIALVRAAMAWRFQRAAQQFDLYPGYHAAFAILMSSSLAGFVLPGGIAQDALRGVQLNSLFNRPGAALSAMLLDKYYGIVAILPVGVAALLVVGDTLPPALNWTFYLALAGALFATLFARPISSWLVRLHMPEKVKQLFAVIAQNIGLSRSFTELLGLSLVIQVLRCLSVIALFYAFDVGIDPMLGFVYVPIVVIVIIAPISIGGLGVREGILLALFLPLGADAERLVLVGIASLLIELVSALPGFWYVVRGFPEPQRTRSG